MAGFFVMSLRKLRRAYYEARFLGDLEFERSPKIGTESALRIPGTIDFGKIRCLIYSVKHVLGHFTGDVCLNGIMQSTLGEMLPITKLS